MIHYRREYHKINSLADSWSGTDQLWIHIYGDNGHARESFADAVRNKIFADSKLLLQTHFDLEPIQNEQQFLVFLRSIFLNNTELFSRYQQGLPRAIAAALQTLIGGRSEGSGDKHASLWLMHAIKNFLGFTSEHQKILFRLDGVGPGKGDAFESVVKLIKSLHSCPLVVVTTGEQPMAEHDSAGVIDVAMAKLPVREAEALTAEWLQTNEINARVLTNHLYLKSRGQVLWQQFIVQTYYCDLPGTDGDALIDAAGLQNLRIPESIEGIFTDRLAALTPAEICLFALLSRLDAGLPLDIATSIFESCWPEDKKLEDLLSLNSVQNYQVQGRLHVVILWREWAEFLRAHSAIEGLKPLLEALQPHLEDLPDTVQFDLSPLYLEIDELSTALLLAHREARFLVGSGQLKRAIDRYGFIRRNLERANLEGLNQQQILKELAALQTQFGIFQNAFETFRDLRDQLEDSDKQGWMEASIHMAEMLYRMDAFSEVRYLIKDLPFKTEASADVLFHSMLLRGEIEQNSGHAEYAAKHFDSAAKMLGRVAKPSLILRLNASMNTILQASGKKDEQIELARQISDRLPEGSQDRFGIELQQIRLTLDRRNFEDAARLSTDLLRSGDRGYVPEQLYRLEQLLAEAYGYLGKWRLAHSRLKRLANNPELTATSRMRTQVLIQLGIVEKELGLYGAAAQRLQQALELAGTGRSARERYQIRLHLGHLHLLVQSFVRAHDYLLETYRWAVETQDEEMLVQAALFLVSYEIHQGRMESALRYWKEAEQRLSPEESRIDELNLFYYRILYDLAAGELTSAEKVVAEFTKKSQGIAKFSMLANWLRGKLMMEKGEYEEAGNWLGSVAESKYAHRLPAIRYQIYRDLAELARCQTNSDRFSSYINETNDALEKLLKLIEDPILQRQFQESREYEELVRLKQSQG